MPLSIGHHFFEDMILELTPECERETGSDKIGSRKLPWGEKQVPKPGQGNASVASGEQEAGHSVWSEQSKWEEAVPER